MRVSRNPSPRYTEGAWIKFDEETSFLIVHARSLGVQVKVQAVAREFMREHERQPDDDELMMMAARTMGRAVIRGWKGVIDEETGQEIPYSEDFAITLMTHPKYQAVRDFVDSHSSKNSTFEQEDAAATVAAIREDARVPDPVRGHDSVPLEATAEGAAEVAGHRAGEAAGTNGVAGVLSEVVQPVGHETASV